MVPVQALMQCGSNTLTSWPARSTRSGSQADDSTCREVALSISSDCGPIGGIHWPPPSACLHTFFARSCDRVLIGNRYFNSPRPWRAPPDGTLPVACRTFRKLPND